MAFQLSAGQFTPAKIAMEIISPRPDVERGTNSRYSYCHSGMENAMPIVVLGGAYPFKYEITANSGTANTATATIGEERDYGTALEWYGTQNQKDYGVFRWTPDSGDDGNTYSFTIRVTDQEGTTADITFTGDVQDSKFVFLDLDTGSSGNAGTKASPKQDSPDIWLNGAQDDGYSSKFIVFRGSASEYSAFGRSTFTAGKPHVFMAYEGETVLFDGTAKDYLFNGDNHDDFWWSGIRVNGTPGTAVTNCRFFEGGGAQIDRPVWWNNYFYQGRVGSVGTDNNSWIYFSNHGTPSREYLSIVGNTFDDANSSSNGFSAFDFFSIEKIVIENNTIKNFTTSIHSWFKDECSDTSYRANSAWEGNLGRVDYTGQDQNGNPQDTHECCWNFLRTTSTGDDVVRWNPTDTGTPPVWAYRNTMVALNFTGVFYLDPKSASTDVLELENNVCVAKTAPHVSPARPGSSNPHGSTDVQMAAWMTSGTFDNVFYDVDTQTEVNTTTGKLDQGEAEWGTYGAEIAGASLGPTISTRTIDASGNTLTLEFSEAVDVSAGEQSSPSFTLSSGQTLTYSSGTGTTTLTYTIGAPTVKGGETPTLTWPTVADGIENATNDDLQAFTNASITNGSTLTTPPTWNTADTANANEQQSILLTVNASGWPEPTYSMGTGDDSAILSVDSTTGVVTRTDAAELDFENAGHPNPYVFTVTATVAGETPLDEQFTVTIVDLPGETEAPTLTSGEIEANGTNMIWVFPVEMGGGNTGITITDTNGDPISVDGEDVVVTDWGAAGPQPTSGNVHFTVAPPIPTTIDVFVNLVKNVGSTLKRSATELYVESFSQRQITNNSTVPASDSEKPVLNGQSGFSTGETTLTSWVYTDTQNDGTIYAQISTSATPPTAATIYGAPDGSVDSGLFYSARQVLFTGLTASTAYYIHFTHRDTAGNLADVVTTAAITTDAAPVVSPVVSNAEFNMTENTLAVGTLEASESPTDWRFYDSATYTDNTNFAVTSGGVVTWTADGNGPDADTKNYYTIAVEAYNAAGGWGTPAVLSVNIIDVVTEIIDGGNTTLTYPFGGSLGRGDASVSAWEAGFTNATRITYSPNDDPLTTKTYTVTFSADEAIDRVATLTVQESAGKKYVFVGSTGTDSTDTPTSSATPFLTAEAAKAYVLTNGLSGVTFQDAGFYNTRIYVTANQKLAVYDSNGDLAGTSGEVYFDLVSGNDAGGDGNIGSPYKTPATAKTDAIANSKKYVVAKSAGYFNDKIYVKANQTARVYSE